MNYTHNLAFQNANPTPTFPTNFPSFHHHGELTAETKQVFACLGEPSITTLEQANTFAQKHLKRQGERWDVQQSTPIRQLCEKNKEELFNHVRLLGMVDAVTPPKKEYAYALVIGATAVRVQERLNHLAELQECGHRFLPANPSRFSSPAALYCAVTPAGLVSSRSRPLQPNEQLSEVY